ncbi:hypothetical protein B0H17DRAFT_1337033, partial [Mycena rosella]
ADVFHRLQIQSPPCISEHRYIGGSTKLFLFCSSSTPSASDWHAVHQATQTISPRLDIRFIIPRPRPRPTTRSARGTS